MNHNDDGTKDLKSRKSDLQGDDPSLCENHDESRINKFDPDVAEGIGMEAPEEQEEE